MFYILVYMVFVANGRILTLIVIMEISYVLHIRKHGICYRSSKPIDSRKVKNESRCFVISCSLLAGQCPAFMAFFFFFCRCGSSRVIELLLPTSRITWGLSVRASVAKTVMTFLDNNFSFLTTQHSVEIIAHRKSLKMDT